MSTRATVHFHYGDKQRPTAIVYRHSDGYPEGLGEDLQTFFKDVQSQTKDTRFDDPAYLAAKFVVWQADKYHRGTMLNFLSVGVVMGDPDDIEYRYHVRCSNDGSIPQVDIENVRE